MQINLKHKNILVGLLLFLAMIARFWKMEYIPFQNDTDEVAHILAGQSLWEGKGPISWSSFYYEGELIAESVNIGDPAKATNYLILSKPWFDHPPLLALISGGFVKLFGYHFPSLPPSLLFRLPMLAISFGSLLLLYLISKHFFGYYPAIFSLILASFSPAFIFGQRMLIGENLFTFFALLSVYLAISVKNTSSRLPLLILLAVLSGLTKVTGLIVLPLVGFYLAFTKQYKTLIYYLTISLLLFALIYGLYGWLIDWQQFQTMLSLQGRRFIGFANPANLFAHPNFIHLRDAEVFFTSDFSYYLIFILGVAGLLIYNHTLAPFLTIAVFGHWLLLWITSAEFSPLNWYKIPLFVWFAIASGAVFKSGRYFILTILIVISTINNFGLTRDILSPRPDGADLRLFLILVFGPLLAVILKPQLVKKISATLLVVALFAYTISSLYIVDKFYDSLCNNQVCPLPLLTTKEILKNLHD